MATISKTGIANGNTAQAEHLTRIIDALDGTAATEVIATGSFTGSFIGDGSGLTGISSDTNFATTDLTFTGNRSHNTDSNYLYITTTGSNDKGIFYMDNNEVSLRQGGTNGLGINITSNFYVYDQSNIARFEIQPSSSVFNNPGGNFDFRIETDTDANAFYAQGSTDKIGIGNNAPNTKLDVNGGISTRVTLKEYGGDNHNVDIGDTSYVYIRATSDIKITGIAAESKNGHRVVIHAGDMSSFSASLMNQDASSTAANRFINGNAGTNKVLQEGDAVEYIYSSGASRWIYMGGSV